MRMRSPPWRDDALEMGGGPLGRPLPGERERRRPAPRRPSRATSAGSRARSHHPVRQQRPTSPCGTRNPVSPWRTVSRSPGLSEASAGVPHAAASTLEMPHPSLGLGSTTAHAERSRRRFSSSDTKPRNRTAPSSPSCRARRSSRGRSSPVPAISSTTSGPARASQRERPQRDIHSFITLQAANVQERGPRGARRRRIGAVPASRRSPDR